MRGEKRKELQPAPSSRGECKLQWRNCFYSPSNQQPIGRQANADSSPYRPVGREADRYSQAKPGRVRRTQLGIAGRDIQHYPVVITPVFHKTTAIKRFDMVKIYLLVINTRSYFTVLCSISLCRGQGWVM